MIHIVFVSLDNKMLFISDYLGQVVQFSIIEKDDKLNLEFKNIIANDCGMAHDICLTNDNKYLAMAGRNMTADFADLTTGTYVSHAVHKQAVSYVG